MQFTVCNLTGEPISGYVETKPRLSANFNVLALRKRKAEPISPSPVSEFQLQPNVNFSTMLPKRCSKRIIFLNHDVALRAQEAKINEITTQTEQVSTSIEKPANASLDNEGTTIPISMACNTSWKAISLNNQIPWKMFLFQVISLHESNLPPGTRY